MTGRTIKSLTKKTYAEMLKKDFERGQKGYPIQAKAIEDYIYKAGRVREEQ